VDIFPRYTRDRVCSIRRGCKREILGRVRGIGMLILKLFSKNDSRLFILFNNKNICIKHTY